MKRGSIVGVILVVWSIAATIVPAAAQDLLRGVGYTFKVQETPRKKSWTATLTFTSFPSGGVIGQLEWPSERSIHKIQGVCNGGTLSFKETEAIKKGGAHLNCVYSLNFNPRTNSFEGTWFEEGKEKKYFGLCSFTLARFSPPPTHEGTTVTLTGSQIARESGHEAQKDCKGLDLPYGGQILSATDAGAGFWLQSMSLRGQQRTFSSAKKSIGDKLPKGKYYAYPNLPNGMVSGSVTLTIQQYPAPKGK